MDNIDTSLGDIINIDDTQHTRLNTLEEQCTDLTYVGGTSTFANSLICDNLTTTNNTGIHMDGRLVITSDDVYGRVQLGLDANSTSLCVVIGKEAGEYTHSSNSYNTFIGTLAGNRIAIEETIDLLSSRGNTCLGALAGRHYTATGNVDYSINIGYKAGNVTCKSRTIILNANPNELNALEEDALYISNMRNTVPVNPYKLMAYDSTSKEIVVNDDFDINLNSVQVNTITSPNDGASSSLFCSATNISRHVNIGTLLQTGNLNLGGGLCNVNIPGTIINNNINSVGVEGTMNFGTNLSTNATINIGTNLSTNGTINIGQVLAQTNISGRVESLLPITDHDESNQVATTKFVYNELTNHNIQHKTRTISIVGASDISPNHGPIFSFYRNTSTAPTVSPRTLLAESRSVGMVMEFIKVDTTDGFTIDCATGVYICPLGDLEATKATSIGFTSADTYMRLICPRTANLWHVVQHY